MNCPNCGTSLRYDRSDEHHENGADYKRTFNVCPSCHTWVTVETPVEVEES